MEPKRNQTAPEERGPGRETCRLFLDWRKRLVIGTTLRPNKRDRAKNPSDSTLKREHFYTDNARCTCSRDSVPGFDSMDDPKFE